MKKRISDILKQPFFYGSAVMIVGSNLTNFLNYIYHLVMGRVLGPSSYGELATLISLSGLLAIIPSSFSLAIIKYVSSADKREDAENLISWFNKKVFLVGFLSFLIIILLSGYISSFLNIKNLLLVQIIGFGFLFSVPSIFNRSVLQGLLRFKEMITSVLVENSLKLLLGLLLVIIGFSVGGALVGLTLAGLAGWILSYLFISDYLKGGKMKPPSFKPFILYSVSVLIQSMAMTSLYSTDLILVKHFLPSHDAGIYASLSTLGKIILFGTGPVGAVMFPLVAQKRVKDGSYKKIFNYSLILTAALAFVILAIYWLQPGFAIKILFGSGYLEGERFLVWFGVFMTLFTLSSLYITYNLSLGRMRAVIFPCLAAATQILLIWFYHPDIMTVVLISILVTALLLLTLLIYSSYEKTASIKNRSGFSDSPGI